MASLVTEKRRGRPAGKKGRCSICWYHGIINEDHNARTCSMAKKAQLKTEEEEDRKKPAPVTPPRDNTPHFDEQYSVAPTPSRSPSYLRRSRRFQEQTINASPSVTQRDQLLASFSKMSIKQNQNNEDNNLWKSYGTCSLCLEEMFQGTISTLLCGHNFHTDCIPDLIERGDDKCPECRNQQAISGLLRPEPPKDKMRDLKAQNYQHLREIVMLKKEVDKLKTSVCKWFKEKEMWEQEARSLWKEFVTEEKASSDFIWRARSKKYI